MPHVIAPAKISHHPDSASMHPGYEGYEADFLSLQRYPDIILGLCFKGHWPAVYAGG